jgi:glutamate-1-semialdehyde 2,1-aminomutase
LETCERLKVTEHIWALGKKLVAGIRQAAQAEGVADHVRMIGYDCNPQLLCTHPDGKYWPELHTCFHEEVISHGVLIPWTSITYSHHEEELDRTIEAVRYGMHKVRDALETNTVDRSFTGEPVKPVFRPYNRCRQGRCGRLFSDAPKLSCCQD